MTSETDPKPDEKDEQAESAEQSQPESGDAAGTEPAETSSPAAETSDAPATEGDAPTAKEGSKGLVITYVIIVLVFGAIWVVNIVNLFGPAQERIRPEMSPDFTSQPADSDADDETGQPAGTDEQPQTRPAGE